MNREVGIDGTYSVKFFYFELSQELTEDIGDCPARESMIELDCMPPDGTAILILDVPNSGRYYYYLDMRKGREFTVRLGRVGTLSGQLQADDPEAVRGVSVQVVSVPSQEMGSSSVTGGIATTVTDEDGRFTITHIAAGRAQVTLEMPVDQPWRTPKDRIEILVEAGKTTTSTIRLVRGVKVTGRVVASGTGEGIEGVELTVDKNRVRTDSQGRYQNWVIPGRLSVSIYRAPMPWFEAMPYHSPEVVEEASVELKPIELLQCEPIRGVIIDEQNRRVTGARVSADWFLRAPRLARLERDMDITGTDGSFTLLRVPADAEVVISAWDDDRATRTPVSVPPGERKAIRLQVRPEAVVKIEGQVRDDSGNPIAEAGSS